MCLGYSVHRGCQIHRSRQVTENKADWLVLMLNIVGALEENKTVLITNAASFLVHWTCTYSCWASIRFWNSFIQYGPWACFTFLWVSSVSTSDLPDHGRHSVRSWCSNHKRLSWKASWLRNGLCNFLCTLCLCIECVGKGETVWQCCTVCVCICGW